MEIIRLGWMLILVGLFFCGPPVFASSVSTNQSLTLTDEERKWISQQPAIRVGITPEWAPFSYYTNEGQPAGVDIDILNTISKRTGLRFEIVRTKSWDETLRRVKEGAIDVTTATAHIPEREKLFHFTRPYSKPIVVIVTGEGDYRFRHISLLQNARIVQPKDHIITMAIRKRLTDANLELLPTQEDCFRRVAEGKADATVANVYTATQFLNSNPWHKLSISGVISDFDFPSCIAIRREQPELAAILDKALATISKDEMDRAMAKHLLFGLQGVSRVALIKKWAVQIFVAGVVIGAGLVLWNYFLSREVRARRKAEGELLEANRSMEVFSHSISHDLRGPLRAIHSFSEILMEEYGERLGTLGRDYLERILASANRVNNLVRDVLAYSQTSRSDFPLRRVSLHDAVHQLIREYPEEQRDCFKIESELPDVWGNGTLLTQVISNLLSNSMKFVPDNRTPEIKIWAERKEDTCRIWIQDNGIGIAPEDQKRIFAMFERVKNPGYEGAGIGLAIVAKALERMNGTAGVESQLGKGSRFWVELPTSPQEKPASTPQRVRNFFAHRRPA